MMRSHVESMRLEASSGIRLNRWSLQARNHSSDNALIECLVCSLELTEHPGRGKSAHHRSQVCLDAASSICSN